MIEFIDDSNFDHTEFIALFGTEKMSFHSLETFNKYLNDFCKSFPEFSIKNSLKVFRVDIYKPLKPNVNA